jgi:hypothetical protein
MIEAGDANPRVGTMQAICKAFVSAGVEFIFPNGGGSGVRFRRKSK